MEVENHQKPQCVCLKVNDRVYGKATKDRKQEPSMFQILTWQNPSLTKYDFKKNGKFDTFNPISQAYMQKIQKKPWNSQNQQNFINYNKNGIIEVDKNIVQQVKSYINHHQYYQNKHGNYQKSKSPKDNRKKNIKNNQYISIKGSQKYIKDKYHYSPEKEKFNSVNDNCSPKKITKSNINQAQSMTRHNVYSKSPNLNRDQHIHECDDEIDEQYRLKLIQKFKQTTRWIPNSSFTTYFGKPPFENYGCGNTKPSAGGLVYGSYLYSHNVHPHRGLNSPKCIQSYPIALSRAKSQGSLIPHPPKTKCKQINEKELQKKSTQINIYPQPNTLGKLSIQEPNLLELQRFGGKGINKTLEATRDYIQEQQIPKKRKQKNNCKKIETKKKQNYEEWIQLKEHNQKNQKNQKQIQPCKTNEKYITGKKIKYN